MLYTRLNSVSSGRIYTVVSFSLLSLSFHLFPGTIKSNVFQLKFYRYSTKHMFSLKLLKKLMFESRFVNLLRFHVSLSRRNVWSEFQTLVNSSFQLKLYSLLDNFHRKQQTRHSNSLLLFLFCANSKLTHFHSSLQ